MLCSCCLAGAFPSFTIQHCIPPRLPLAHPSLANPLQQPLQLLSALKHLEKEAQRGLGGAAWPPSCHPLTCFGAAGTWSPGAPSCGAQHLPPRTAKTRCRGAQELGSPCCPIPRHGVSPLCMAKDTPSPGEGVTGPAGGESAGGWAGLCTAHEHEHPPLTAPLQPGPPGVPQCPPQPHQGFAAAPTAPPGLAQATVIPSPGAAPSLPTLRCCWGPSVRLRSSSIPRPSGVGTSCAR